MVVTVLILAVDKDIHSSLRVGGSHAVDKYAQFCTGNVIDPGYLGMRCEYKMIQKSDQLVTFSDGHPDQHIACRSHALVGHQTNFVKLTYVYDAEFLRFTRIDCFRARFGSEGQDVFHFANWNWGFRYS